MISRESLARKRLAYAALILGLALGGRQIQAAPACSSTIDLGPSGTGSIDIDAVTPGLCVLAQDKLYGGFNIAGLPGSGDLVFQLTTIGSVSFHQLSFNAAFVSGTTYSFAYEVQMAPNAPPGSIITGLDADFTQTFGTSTLAKNSTPQGTPLSGISETKVGTIVQPGGRLAIDYLPGGVSDLVIAETLTDGGTVSAITNTVTENLDPVTEPSTLVVFGAGMISLGFLARRHRP
jgi:hypothetical protein